MDHSLHPRLHEYLFEVENALLTLPRAVGNLAGNTIRKYGRMSEKAETRYNGL